MDVVISEIEDTNIKSARIEVTNWTVNLIYLHSPNHNSIVHHNRKGLNNGKLNYNTGFHIVLKNNSILILGL